MKNFFLCPPTLYIYFLVYTLHGYSMHQLVQISPGGAASCIPTRQTCLSAGVALFSHVPYDTQTEKNSVGSVQCIKQFIEQGTVVSAIGLGDYQTESDTSEPACTCNWIPYCRPKTAEQRQEKAKARFQERVTDPLDQQFVQQRGPAHMQSLPSFDDLRIYPGIAELLDAEPETPLLRMLLHRLKKIVGSCTVGGIRYVHCGIAPSSTTSHRALCRAIREHSITEETATLIRARLTELTMPNTTPTHCAASSAEFNNDVVRTWLQEQLAQSQAHAMPTIITHQKPLFFKKMEQEDWAQKQEFQDLIAQYSKPKQTPGVRAIFNASEQETGYQEHIGTIPVYAVGRDVFSVVAPGDGEPSVRLYRATKSKTGYEAHSLPTGPQ